MTEKIGDLGYIIVDCLDNARVAHFWGKVLGLEITDQSPPYIDLARPGANAPVMSFQKVIEPKVGKNRLHVDVVVPDLQIATEQIEAIGGRLVQECFEDVHRWNVMADPEENEFCIVLN